MIEVEGQDAAVEGFLCCLEKEAPPLARLEATETCQVPLRGGSGFRIWGSLAEIGKFALVSPDVAMCEDCGRELRDPADRRTGYPFINCTNCGPRYSIIQDIPYDRPSTTMAAFRMCGACQAEYDDPASRRFHAQPNACPRCGPSVTLVESGTLKAGNPALFSLGDEAPAAIRQARTWLAEGKIIAIKGLGGFHLACDAENDAAVERLRDRKRRSQKPFALMAPDLATIEQFCSVSEADREALRCSRRPIVLLPCRHEGRIARGVAPANNTLGVMLPYTPMHELLLRDEAGAPAFRALVMTSGNLSEEPIVHCNEEARTRLGQLADAFLFHNRDIYMRVDDSVVRTFEGRERVLRRSRGYAPLPIELGRPVGEILACGGDLKNTFCLTKDRYAILSQHLGDLENYETLAFFEETLANLRKVFRVEPQLWPTICTRGMLRHA